MPRNTLAHRPCNRQFVNAKSFWESQQDISTRGRSTLPVYTLRHTRGITAPGGGASSVSLSNLYKQEAYTQAALQREQCGKAARELSQVSTHSRAPSWITPHCRETISRCILRNPNQVSLSATRSNPVAPGSTEASRPATPNLGSGTFAPEGNAGPSSWATELLSAFSSSGILRKPSVLTSNSDLPELLLGQWLADKILDPADESESIVQVLLKQNSSVLSVSSTGEVTHRDDGSCFPCGCSGGAIWRCRIAKQRKKFSDSRWLSKIASWAEKPTVEPLHGDALHPEVETLLLQYLGEATPCDKDLVSPSCPKRWRGYYASAADSKPLGLKDSFLLGFRTGSDRVTNSHLRLQKLTPFFDLRASLFKVYAADRKAGSCHIFHGDSRLALLQNEHTVFAKLPDRSQDHATVHTIRRLVKTSRAAECFMRRARRTEILDPVIVPSIVTRTITAEPMQYFLGDEEDGEETCCSRKAAHSQSLPMVPYLNLENTTLQGDISSSSDEDDELGEEFMTRKEFPVPSGGNNEVTFRVMTNNQ